MRCLATNGISHSLCDIHGQSAKQLSASACQKESVAFHDRLPYLAADLQGEACLAAHIAWQHSAARLIV